MFAHRQARFVAASMLACSLCWINACKDKPNPPGEAPDDAFGAFVKPDVDDTADLWERAASASKAAPAKSSVGGLADGERLAFVEVGATAALGGAIRPGDRIDIAGSFEIEVDPPLEPKTRADAADASKTSNAGENASKQPAWVHIVLLQNVPVHLIEPTGDGRFALGLQLAADAASLLRVAKKRATLHTMLRHRDDTEVVGPRRATIRSVIEDLEILNRQRKSRQNRASDAPDAAEATAVSARLRKERRAVALALDVPQLAFSTISAGDHVDIAGIFALNSRDRAVPVGYGSGRSIDLELLQNVRVLEVSVSDDAQDGAGGLLVVEVTTDEAEMLALASLHTQIDVTLRGPGDDDIDSISRTTTRKLLQDLEIVHRKRVVRTKKRRRRRRMRRPSSRKKQTKQKKGHDMIIGLGGAHSSGSRGGGTRGASPQGSTAGALGSSSAKQPSAAAKKVAPSEPARRQARAVSMGIVDTQSQPRSTFSFDVDTSSYTLVRRHLREDDLPVPEMVRVEEFINYFDYSVPPPKGQPFAVSLEAAPNPFRRSKRHYLMALGVRAGEGEGLGRKPVNLTLLVDTSSSMRGGDRIGLLQEAIAQLAKHLRADDTVAIIGYGSGVEPILDRVSGDQSSRIIRAIRTIEPRGMSAMQAGVERAYWLADAAFEEDAENRVIILSDGDPNIGAETHEELLETVRAERARGITLSTVGFGRGNYRDHLMEQFADNGDGNNYYVDSRQEAARLFGERILPTLIVVARDVKAQLEFDPTQVVRYRRVGYDNRALSEADFDDAGADAAEIGAGQRVTVLYEIELAEGAGDDILGTAKIRYKRPGSDEPMQVSAALERAALGTAFSEASADFRLAASLMGFAEVLEQTPLGARLSLTSIHQTAESAAGDDPDRREFIELIERARALKIKERAPKDGARSKR